MTNDINDMCPYPHPAHLAGCLHFIAKLTTTIDLGDLNIVGSLETKIMENRIGDEEELYQH